MSMEDVLASFWDDRLRCPPPDRSPGTLPGSALRVGDTIEVWWRPGRDTITKLVPYTGCLPCLHGAQLADFALLPTGMTIEPQMLYRVLHRS